MSEAERQVEGLFEAMLVRNHDDSVKMRGGIADRKAFVALPECMGCKS